MDWEWCWRRLRHQHQEIILLCWTAIQQKFYRHRASIISDSLAKDHQASALAEYFTCYVLHCCSFAAAWFAAFLGIRYSGLINLLRVER